MQSRINLNQVERKKTRIFVFLFEEKGKIRLKTNERETKDPNLHLSNTPIFEYFHPPESRRTTIVCTDRQYNLTHVYRPNKRRGKMVSGGTRGGRERAFRWFERKPRIPARYPFQRTMIRQCLCAIRNGESLTVGLSLITGKEHRQG